MNDLHDLRRMLSLWGRLCRAVGQGYPTMSATERARIGRGGVFDGANLPDDVAELDSAVARCQPQHKLILVEIYTKGGERNDHIARLKLHNVFIPSVDAYYRRKKSAEVHLNTLWRSANEQVLSRAS